MRTKHAWLIGFLLLIGRGVAEEPGAWATSGPLDVETRLLTWVDEARKREVPVKLYLPPAATEPSPVIVFSHGLGGTREGYAYLGKHWASHGYVAVHVQHHGSDDAVWRTNRNPLLAMRRAAKDPQTAIARPRDVSFVIDRLTALNGEGQALAGRLDLQRLGVAGHSFGAWTTLALAGQKFGRRQAAGNSLADARIKAAIAMSAPVPDNPRQHKRAFADLQVPVFHMTGTRDESVIGHTTAAARRIPYDMAEGTEQLLLVFEGGDHMVFSGRARRRAQGRHAVFQRLVQQASLAFWHGWLRDDDAARTWLLDGGFANALGEAGTFQCKVED